MTFFQFTDVFSYQFAYELLQLVVKSENSLFVYSQ